MVTKQLGLSIGQPNEQIVFCDRCENLIAVGDGIIIAVENVSLEPNWPVYAVKYAHREKGGCYRDFGAEESRE